MLSRKMTDRYTDQQRLAMSRPYFLRREISQTGYKISNKQLDILYKRFIMKEYVLLYNNKQLYSQIPG